MLLSIHAEPAATWNWQELNATLDPSPPSGAPARELAERLLACAELRAIEAAAIDALRADDRTALEAALAEHAKSQEARKGRRSLAAEQRPETPTTYEAAVQRMWKTVHDKLLAMAKDTQFPDAKLGWKPHPDSRSVMDELRHVTIGLQMTSALARGGKFDFEAAEKAVASKPKTRASVVSEMEAAIAESYPLVDSKPSLNLVFWIEH